MLCVLTVTIGTATCRQRPPVCTSLGRQTSSGRGEESAVRGYGAVIHELLWASSHRGFSPVRLKGTDVVRVGGGRLRRGGGVAAGVGAVAGVALLAGVGGGATTPW